MDTVLTIPVLMIGVPMAMRPTITGLTAMRGTVTGLTATKGP